MRYRIGIDLGGTKTEAAVLEPGGDIAWRRRTDTPPAYPDVIRAMAGLVAAAESELGLHATVGVGIPGVISPATGLVKNAKYSDVKKEIPPLFFKPYRQDENLGSINFYVGPPPGYTTCPPNVWLNTGNLAAPTNLVDASQLGGSFYEPYGQVQATYGSYSVTGISLVVDGYAADQTARSRRASARTRRVSSSIFGRPRSVGSRDSTSLLPRVAGILRGGSGNPWDRAAPIDRTD